MRSVCRVPDVRRNKSLSILLWLPLLFFISETQAQDEIERQFLWGNQLEGRNPEGRTELYLERDITEPYDVPGFYDFADRLEPIYVPPAVTYAPRGFYGGVFEDYRELSDFYDVPGGYRRYDVFGPGAAYPYNPYDDTAFLRSDYFDYYTRDYPPYFSYDYYTPEEETFDLWWYE